jgi:hypothetical protein
MITQQRRKLAQQLLLMQCEQYKDERNSRTIDRFLSANKDFKLPGGGSDDYRRDQMIREMSKLKRK